MGLSLLIELVDRSMDDAVELVHVGEGAVGEVAALEVAPGASMSFSSGARFGNRSTVSQGRSLRALHVARLVWIGPLSSTRTTGRSPRSGPGPYFRSSRASKSMKSTERLVALLATMSRPAAWSRVPSRTRRRACPGASTRSSAPRLAHRARRARSDPAKSQGRAGGFGGACAR